MLLNVILTIPAFTSFCTWGKQNILGRKKNEFNKMLDKMLRLQNIKYGEAKRNMVLDAKYYMGKVKKHGI
jgi:hypothetical protein